MTSMTMCKQTQQQKIQIMLAFYEQGLLKYGSRGRPSRIKLLKRYTSLFEPSVQLTDIATLLEDTKSDVLTYSDIAVTETNNAREQGRSCLYNNDFTWNNREFYANPIEHQDSRRLPAQSDRVESLCFSEDTKLSDAEPWTSCHEYLDSTSCDTSYSWTPNSNLQLDSENSSVETNTLVKQEVQKEITVTKVDTVGDTNCSENNNTCSFHLKAENSDISEKVCYMEQLGLKPKVQSLLKCSKACEDILDTFQRFIDADENCKKLSRNVNRNSSYSQNIDACDNLDGKASLETQSPGNVKVTPPKMSNRLSKTNGPEQPKHPNKCTKTKLAYSQGCLRKNLKMFARDLQIYAHQRKVTKTKVHISGQQVVRQKGNKAGMPSQCNPTKSEQFQQDQKLKEVITKLKGKHSNSSRVSQENNGYEKLAKHTKHSHRNNCMQSQSNLSDQSPHIRASLVPSNTGKSTSEIKVKDLKDNTTLNVTSEISPFHEEPGSQNVKANEETDVPGSPDSTSASCASPYVVKYDESSESRPPDSKSENHSDICSDRKQYFMRQRKLIRFPSTGPSSILGFIRPRKLAGTLSLKRSVHHLAVNKFNKAAFRDNKQRLLSKSVQGGFNKKRNALMKLKNERHADSDTPTGEVGLDECNKRHTCDSKKRKLQSSISKSKGSTVAAKRVCQGSNCQNNQTDHNPERFLKEFSRHNWLVNKYQLVKNDLCEGLHKPEVLVHETKFKDSKRKTKENAGLHRSNDVPASPSFDEEIIGVESNPKKCEDVSEGHRGDTDYQAKKRSPDRLDKSPPLLIPVSQSQKGSPTIGNPKQNNQLTCHSAKEQLPQIPPLKHDDHSEKCIDSSSNSMAIAIGTLQNDTGNTTLHNREMDATLDSHNIIRCRDIEPNTDALVSPPLLQNPDVIVITPSDDEYYSQVPTPIASSPNESELKTKPSLIPLHDTHSDIHNGKLTPCKILPKEILTMPQANPLQIVNTAFLPGSVLVVCNAPVSSSTTSQASHPQTETFGSQTKHSPTKSLHPVLPKVHASPKASVNKANDVIPLAYSQNSPSQDSYVLDKPKDNNEQLDKSETKQSVHYVDLTDDKITDANQKITRTSPQDESNEVAVQIETLMNQMIADVSDGPSRPELKKLKQEYLKFSKIFKRLTHIEEMKEKERKVLQEKKMQATMLMQTIKKQYENIKQNPVPETQIKKYEVDTSSHSEEDVNSTLSKSSVQAHTKQNRVKLLIDCEPPPAHENSSKCIDYVSLSNVECNFVKCSQTSTISEQPPNTNNVPIYSVHLKQQDHHESGSHCAVDLSRRNDDKSSGSAELSDVTASNVLKVNKNLQCQEKAKSFVPYDQQLSVKQDETVKITNVSLSQSRNTPVTANQSKNREHAKLQPTSGKPKTPDVRHLQPHVYQHQLAPQSAQVTQRGGSYHPLPQYAQGPQQYGWRPPRPLFPSHPLPLSQVQQQMPTQSVPQQRFVQPAQNERSPSFRPPQRLAPYRLGNLATVPITTQQRPLYGPPNQTIANIPPRFITYGATKPTALNHEYRLNRPLLPNSNANLNTLPVNRLDQMPPRPHLGNLSQRNAVPLSNPQRPIPIRGSMPLLQPNMSERIDGPSAFLPISQMNQPIYPGSPNVHANNGLSGMPVPMKPNTRIISGPSPRFCPPVQQPKQNHGAVLSPAQENVMATSAFKNGSPKKPQEDQQVQSMWMQFNKGLLKCGICQKKAMFVCSRCKEMPYCSEYCQTESWSKHAPICGQRRKSL